MGSTIYKRYQIIAAIDGNYYVMRDGCNICTCNSYAEARAQLDELVYSIGQ